jgi:polysulfide reductase chain C
VKNSLSSLFRLFYAVAHVTRVKDENVFSPDYELPGWEVSWLPSLKKVKEFLSAGLSRTKGKNSPRVLDVSGLTRSIHPQKEWEWPIAVYLYLAGMGAGAFAVGVLISWIAQPAVPSTGILLWGALLVALGAPFLVLDLGKKTRFINACLNPRTSWAARGFVILTSLMITGISCFLLAVLPDILPLLHMSVPSWIVDHPSFSRILQAIALLLSLGTAAYTGMFLKSTKYVSLWNSWWLPVLFLFSALSTGITALISSLLVFGLVQHNLGLIALTRMLLPYALALIAVEGIVLMFFVKSFRQNGTVKPNTIKHLILKSIPGLVLTALLLIAASSIPTPAFTNAYSVILLVAGALVMAGGLLLRFDVLKMGVKDPHPMQKMAGLQFNWQSLADSHVKSTGINLVQSGYRD